MNRLSLLLALTLCFPLAAHADDASRRAKAVEMLSLLHMDRLMTQMMEGIMKQTSVMMKQMIGGNIKPEEQARLDDFQKQLFTLVETEMGWKSIEPQYVQLYADNFTDEELDGIIAFYKSPAGSAVLDKMPTLTAEGLKLSQARMTTILPKVQQMIADFARDATRQPTRRPPVSIQQ